MGDHLVGCSSYTTLKGTTISIKTLKLEWTHSYCPTPLLGLELGVDFTFAGDNHKNHKNHNNDNNPHLNFGKGIVIGDKEQGVGIRDKR